MPLATALAGLEGGKEDGREEGWVGGRLFKGRLRLNPRNPKAAYVTPEGNNPFQVDILIEGPKDRNRALEGDVVVVEVFPVHKWGLKRREQKQQPARGLEDGREEVGWGGREEEGEEAGVKEEEEEELDRLEGVAEAVPVSEEDGVVDFIPSDSRAPRLLVPRLECPYAFLQRPMDFVDKIFLVRMKEVWKADSARPFGEQARCLGEGEAGGKQGGDRP
ncbi:hypothetical protein Naga_100363g1 [Nannochloropsis gaditana]|uniref:CSD2 domain-containing protein n=1 Tax=Nannochloropsis gaditana TaxID=72520 RepID=W7TH22_9STRA|nr:hypothetical protein Naga_100363g1 [Nannochloropsis gaditana]